MILDCCYSGRAHSSVYLDNPDDAQELARQAPIEGACVLTATSDYARALATPGHRYTAFSGALISALENGLPDAGAYLEIRSIFAFLRQEMRSRGLPQPHLSTRDDGSELVLGRNVAYTGPPVAPPKESEVVAPPRVNSIYRRRRWRRLIVLAAILTAVSVTATLMSFLARSTGYPTAGLCPAGVSQEATPSSRGRPGKDTPFPESHIRLLRDLVGPTTVVGFEPPRAKNANPVTYLWQPDRRCFAIATGFGSDYLDVAVSPDGKWIAGVDMRDVPGAAVTVMDRAGGKKQVIEVPASEFATHLQWNKTSTALLFTEAQMDAKGEYDYPRGSNAVIASLPTMSPTVLPLGANAPYQWGTDGDIVGNFGQQDPLDVKFFDSTGKELWTIEHAGLLGQNGMGAFSPSGEQMVTHCPDGAHDDQACVWDPRTRELLGKYPTARIFADRPYGSVGWYDEKNLLMTIPDATTKWWADATLDVADPLPNTGGLPTITLSRIPDKDGHLFFESAPS